MLERHAVSKGVEHLQGLFGFVWFFTMAFSDRVILNEV
jgi:hypothetical protein